MDKCCVCGTTANKLNVYISTLTKEKKTYCYNCIMSGFEPYDDLVNFGWKYDMFNKTYQQKVLLPTLSLNGKTVVQFNDDVQKKRDEKDAQM